MYRTKAAALRAYAAYRAISHTETFMKHLQFIVKRAKALSPSEDTTSSDIARRVVRRATKRVKKKK